MKHSPSCSPSPRLPPVLIGSRPSRPRRIRDGSVTAEGLRFMRNGVAESAVHTDGDATGLKYLAGKQDCLRVKPREGYCRD